MENHDVRLNHTFHALADPTRRAVIARLTETQNLSVTELAAPFSMGLPAFLKHLRVLEESGLIATTKVGRVRTCAIQPERLAEVEFWLAERRQRVESQLDRFSAYVDSLNRDEEI